MDIQQSVEKIYKQILLPGFNFDNLINWAIEMIQNGYDGENLLILTSLEFGSNSEIVLDYFNKSLEELNIIVEYPKFETFKEKAKYYIDAMNLGLYSAKSTLARFVDLCIESSYDDKLLPFYVFNDEIDMLIFENPKTFKSQTGYRNLESYIFNNLNKLYQD